MSDDMRDEDGCPACQEAADNPHPYQVGEADGCNYELPSGFLCGGQPEEPEHR